MSLPVKFAIDRAGIVGEDGETHQGLLDIAYLRPIPNMILFAPYDNASLEECVKFANSIDFAPCAFRYPRGGFAIEEGVLESKPFVLAKMQWIWDRGEILLIGYGNGVGRAYNVAKKLEANGVICGLLDLRFLKPLDSGLKEVFKRYKKVYVFSDSYALGGVGSAILEFMSINDCFVPLHSFEIKDSFIEHGNVKEVEAKLGLDTMEEWILQDIQAKGIK